MKYLKLIVLLLPLVKSPFAPEDLRIGFDGLGKWPPTYSGRKSGRICTEVVYQIHVTNITNPDAAFTADISVASNSEMDQRFERLLVGDIGTVEDLTLQALSHITGPFKQIEFQWSDGLCNFSLDHIKPQAHNLPGILGILGNFVVNFVTTEDSMGQLTPVQDEKCKTLTHTQRAFNKVLCAQKHGLFGILRPLINFELPFDEVETYLIIVDRKFNQPMNNGMVIILDHDHIRQSTTNALWYFILFDKSRITIYSEDGSELG
jgi:hypothetical protein